MRPSNPRSILASAPLLVGDAAVVASAVVNSEPLVVSLVVSSVPAVASPVVAPLVNVSPVVASLIGSDDAALVAAGAVRSRAVGGPIRSDDDSSRVDPDPSPGARCEATAVVDACCDSISIESSAPIPPAVEIEGALAVTSA